jgi:ribosomal protein L24
MSRRSIKDQVQIVAGPLKGLQGTLLRIPAADRAVVRVPIGNRQVLVELDSAMLRRTAARSSQARSGSSGSNPGLKSRS